MSTRIGADGQYRTTPSELPPRDPALEAERIRAGMEETARELQLLGFDRKTASELVNRYRDHFGTKQFFAGPALRVSPISGEAAFYSVHQLREFAGEIAEVAHLESFGPDPAELLRQKLVDVGMEEVEAAARVRGRIRRLPDGAVEWRSPGGGEPEVYREPPEEDAAARAGAVSPLSRFIATAARQVLREKKVGPEIPTVAPRSPDELEQEKRASGTYTL